MYTHVTRIVLLVGLGLSMLLSPLNGRADDHRKIFSITVDGETVSDLDVTVEAPALDLRTDRKTLRGSGYLVKRTLPAPDFHAVSVAQGIAVVIGGTEEIVIEADDNLIDQLTVEAVRGTLQIRFENNNSIRDVHVTVQIPNNGKIDAIEASSAASVTTKQALQSDEMQIQLSSAATLDAALKVDRCEIYLSSAARMKCAAEFVSCRMHLSSASKLRGSLQAKRLTAELSSASKASLKGSCESLTATLSSSGKLEAEELEASVVEVQASSSSSAEVWCTEKLTAGASSGASVYYTGDCRVYEQTSSGGRITQR